MFIRCFRVFGWVDRYEGALTESLGCVSDGVVVGEEWWRELRRSLICSVYLYHNWSITIHIHIVVSFFSVIHDACTHDAYCFEQDIVGLRKVAAIRGLVDHRLRRRAWPFLLGISGPAFDDKSYKNRAQLQHKDSHVVLCDMERSLFVGPSTIEERDQKRTILQRVIESTIAGNETGIHYYQGFHDIASVILLVSEGEYLSSRILQQLASCHLRDCTRSTLEAATEVLGMLYPILEIADPDLHAFLASLDAPTLQDPHWALSWYLTWFSHDIKDMEQVARLFDLFIASHPLMPVYLAAVVVRSQRDLIFECAKDGGDIVYATLRRLQVLPGVESDGDSIGIAPKLSADELAQQAVALYRSAPPRALRHRWANCLVHATTLDAYLYEGRWKVPEAPPRKNMALKLGLKLSNVGQIDTPRLRPPVARSVGQQQVTTVLAAAVFTGLAGITFLFAQLQALGTDQVTT